MIWEKGKNGVEGKSSLTDVKQKKTCLIKKMFSGFENSVSVEKSPHDSVRRRKLFHHVILLVLYN